MGLSGLSHTEQVRRLIEGGARFIQLREKSLSSGEFFADAAQAVKFAHEYSAQIIINDRVDIALALHADGVHLGQDDLWPDEARKILGPDAIIGFSTHSVEQASDALKLPVDYIAIGPIFGTSTKENPDPIVGPDGLHAVRKAIGEMPLVAIGGIDLDSLSTVYDAGANSAAVISSIISQPDQIAERVRQFLNAP